MTLGLAVQHQTWPLEDRTEKTGQRRRDLAELREHEHFFLPRGDHFGNFAQARPFAAVGFAPRAVTQPLRRMVADLLKAHQVRQDQPFAFYSGSFRELPGQFLHRLLVQCRLRTGERAERLDFGFVRQIRDHGPVRLQAPQNVRLHQFAQGAIGSVRAVCQPFGEVCELLRRSQQAGVDEIEQRP